MDLGARLATANLELAEQFRRALDFWSTVVKLSWHEEDSQDCSIQLLDGQRELFEPEPATMAARSQFPDRVGFQGWIAFNPSLNLTKNELYRISVHEIGHLLGLRHSTNIRSVMYSLDLDDSNMLDLADLTALAAHHQLRIASLRDPVTLMANVKWRPPVSAFPAK